MVDFRYYNKEFRILQDKIYKALNIYEEDNNIEPQNKKAKKKIEVLNPLPFSQYVDEYIVKNIEGMIFDINGEDENITNKLLDVKLSLMELQYRKGEEGYRFLRKKIFQNLELVNELVKYVEDMR